MADASHAAGAWHINELEAARGAHGSSLYRPLRALCGAGLFVEDEPRRFALTLLGDTLRTNVLGLVRAAVIWIGEPMYARSCGEVLTSVMISRPALDGILGMPYFDYLTAHPDAGRIFREGMACFAAMENEPIAQAYEFPAAARVVDVGGGQEVPRRDPHGQSRGSWRDLRPSRDRVGPPAV